MIILNCYSLNHSFPVRHTLQMLGKAIPLEDLKRKLTATLSADIVGYNFPIKRDRIVEK